MTRSVCIHGHFYQPPRENPWTGEVEAQPSAEPFHDWNERVTAECYEPNSKSRVMAEGDEVVRTANNYERISHNVGPTLLSWMKTKRIRTYEAILGADEVGSARFGGAGPALAQVYGHAILPLCNERDRRTQVRWGVSDFVTRYGRSPAGMWLAETAVDTASLEALAAEGIRYTILAPHQAEALRPPEGEWSPADEATLPTGRPYTVPLPSGATIAVFFYDGGLSREVAFNSMLSNGDEFAARLLDEFHDADIPQLVHIATDGESYGHHHEFGEMALTRALDVIDARDDVNLTTYEEYLELNPPVWEARIRENSSWSCSHGVERWRADCGCSTGGEEGWTQAWRAPLRQALDDLRNDLAGMFEREGARVFDDPWVARDDYIRVQLDPGATSEFLAEHGAGSEQAEADALRLLEMQRNALFMQTSCGWFFNDLSGIETVQILRYAACALDLAEPWGAASIRNRFLETLAKAESNRKEVGSGVDLWGSEVLSVRPSL